MRYAIYKLLTILAGALIVLASCRHTDTPIAAPAQVRGCMDVLALNYNPNARISDSAQCRYAIDSVVGVYDVVDTYIHYSGLIAPVTIGRMEIIVTRESATALWFNRALGCTNCKNGGLPYDALTHSFSYTDSIDATSISVVSGRFAGDTLHYKRRLTNSLNPITPSRSGSGVRRK
jgi:hypothetical protein